MYGDYEYRFDEAEECGSSNTLLSDNDCEVVSESNGEYPPATLAVHHCTLPNVATATQQSPNRFLLPYSDCINTTMTVGKDTDRSANLAGHGDTTAIVRPEKTGQIDAAAVYGAENEMSGEKKEDNDDGASSESDIDETKSITNHSMLCEAHEDVDWSELASARAALQSSDDASSRPDDGAESWTDDEEPELRNLLVNSSTETIDSKNSEDHENDIGEDEECDCDDQPQQVQETNNFIVNENSTFEEVCLSSSTYYFACSDKEDGKDESRMQRADDDGECTCSCCKSPLHVDKWTPDGDDDDELKTSNDSGPSADSMADWYQQQIVCTKHDTISGDFRHQRAKPRQQNTFAAVVSNYDSASVAEEAKPCTRSDDDNGGDNDGVIDTQRPAAGEEGEFSQWNMERYVGKSGFGGGRQCQLPVDDVNNCCADCSGGCYDDRISTFYVNYQHQTATVVDAGDSLPTLSGVQVCAPANFELLFLIDQLASTACFVDEAAAFMTLLQSAAVPSAASALYVDSSPRTVELITDDEADAVSGHLTARSTAAGRPVDSHQDNGDAQLNTDKTTPVDLTGCKPVEGYLKIPTAMDCPGKQSDVTTEYTGGKDRHSQKRSGELQKEEMDDAEAQVPSVASLRRSRVPDVRGGAGDSQTKEAKRSDDRCPEAAGQHQQRRRLLPLLDARTSTVSKDDHDGQACAGLMWLPREPTGETGLSRQERQQRVTAGGQRDKYKLRDVFVDRRPPLPPAARRCEPSLGRGLRLPPVNSTQRVPRETPRVFPPPPQRRRSHPLAPRRPMTPPNRNVLASRAVWPSMASGRPVDDEWSRRAALLRRRTRLPPLHHTATVATWH